MMRSSKTLCQCFCLVWAHGEPIGKATAHIISAQSSTNDLFSPRVSNVQPWVARWSRFCSGSHYTHIHKGKRTPYSDRNALPVLHMAFSMLSVHTSIHVTAERHHTLTGTPCPCCTWLSARCLANVKDWRVSHPPPDS